jgi:hypothetical protein
MDSCCFVPAADSVCAVSADAAAADDDVLMVLSLIPAVTMLAG